MATEKDKTKTTTKSKTASKIRTAIKTKTERKAAGKSGAKNTLAPHKLVLLVTVVPRHKADFYLDLLQSFEVNLQLEVSAFGTASAFGFLGADNEKQVLFSIIREDNVAKALAVLEDKFESIRGGKGVAFTVPFTSIVGVVAYQFLSNKQ